MKKITVISFLPAVLLYFFLGRHQSAWICSVFKVLPCMILSLAILISVRRYHSVSRSAGLCMAALFFSMLGDVFGEFKSVGGSGNAFILQIASFAIAQVFYAVSFMRFFRRDLSLLRNAVRMSLCIVLAAYLIGFGQYLLSFVDSSSLKTAVSVYIFLIGMMGVSSIVQCRKGQWWFIIGAFLFISSDSILAYRTFIGRIPQAGLLIMSTYYAAQLLLNLPIVINHENR